MKIVLCGFMGCGKSSVGIRLSKLISADYIDMDKFIESKAHKTISKIFEEDGEQAFRNMETEASKELMKRENAVIACGGGTVMNPLNVEAFRNGGGVICFLDVPVAALQERLKGDKKRPLLQRPDRAEFIKTLHAERYPKYLAASDVVVDAGAPAGEVASRIFDICNKRASEEK